MAQQGEIPSDSNYDLITSPSTPVKDVSSVEVSSLEGDRAATAPSSHDTASDTTNLEVKVDSVGGTEVYKKDDMFFFSMVTFLVEDHLFRVPRDPFEHQSEHFRNRLAKARTCTSGEIDEPVPLEGVDKDIFKDLLRLLYPPSQASVFATTAHLTRDQWIKVLDFTHTWGFSGIHSLAIQQLEFFKLEEVEKLELALKYTIKQWYADAYLALAKRPQPLTTEEGGRLGLNISLKMAKIREQRLTRVIEVPPVATSSPAPATTSDEIASTGTSSAPGTTLVAETPQKPMPRNFFLAQSSPNLTTDSFKEYGTTCRGRAIKRWPYRTGSTVSSLDPDDVQLKRDIKEEFGF